MSEVQITAGFGELCVVMPVYNEISTVDEIVHRVLESPFTGQLIIVDDGSTDGTAEKLESLGAESRVQVVLQGSNQGKGAALRRGFQEAVLPYVVIQDADLEYDPREYELLLGPLLSGDADVVYGSRFASGRPHRVLFFWHSIGNRVLTLLSNMTTNLNLTDMETCYKAFRLQVIEDLELTENRFGIEPEITAQVAAFQWRVWEVGISYAGRTYAEGKKIGWRDGLRAVFAICYHSARARRIRAGRESLAVA